MKPVSHPWKLSCSSSDPDSGGLGLHSNLRGLSDVSQALSASTGVYETLYQPLEKSLTLASPDATTYEESELGGESRPRPDILSDPVLFLGFS